VLVSHRLRSLKDGLVLVGILGLALGLRLTYVDHLPAEAVLATVDAKGYYLLAMNWLEGGPPSLLSGVRMPLYPAFVALVLSVTREASHAIPLVQSWLDTATVALVYGLVVRLTTLRRGQFAALLYALNPISFLFIGTVLTEIFLAFLMALTFYIFVIALESNGRRCFLLAVTGFMSGLSILCKPNVIGLPLILAAGLFFDCRRFSWRIMKEASLVVGVALLALLPWLVRNRLVFGEWVLSLAFDSTLTRVSAVATILEVEGEEVAPWTPRWEEVYLNQVAAVAENLYGWAEEGETLSEAVSRRHEMAVVAKDIIRQHPSAFVRSHLRGVLNSFVPSLHRDWYIYLVGKPWPENEALRTTLNQAIGEIGQGDWSAGLGLVTDWWRQLPALARGLWLASNTLQCLAYGLVVAGLWSLRTRPGVFFSLGLVLLYLLLLPGPIAYVRFWMPGVPLATGVMACVFHGRGTG
jgi:4-amino-4-deoxy-L-arabinose transferase-like glycosyltransferase